MVSMATLIFVELLKIMFSLINHYTCNADTPYLGQNLSVIRALRIDRGSLGGALH